MYCLDQPLIIHPKSCRQVIGVFGWESQFLCSLGVHFNNQNQNTMFLERHNCVFLHSIVPFLLFQSFDQGQLAS